MSGSEANKAVQAVRVWDLPTRAFHWALAALVLGSFASAWIGGNAMAWHLRSGYAVLTLLMFRLLWGIVGGRWSRFASFFHGPATTLRYLRGASRADDYHDVGHNPLGALSVFGLLAILAAQVGTGLFADDEIATTGPLTKFVSDATSGLATHWHKNVGQWLIIALVLLHLGAIAFYRLRRGRDLVRPMLTGDKMLAGRVPESVDSARHRGLALTLVALCAALVGWLVGLGG